MQPTRWQQVSQIFEAALVLGPEERVAFIKTQCAGDESLRREVELLIHSHQQASDEQFIGGHAFERAAPMLANESELGESTERLREGHVVGHYQVIERIGAGGMGEVYKAKDTLLDRIVALKILPADVSSDSRRMLRFKQEARSVSALNQPNILTIYESGEAESLPFIATEYIDGDTLRRYLRGNKVKLVEIIDIGIQVAAALDAAHEAKIVHRDIKPENIMIRRRDALVKVLDFGLAKLTEKEMPTRQSTDTEAATEMLLKTMPGSVLGTVNYMSPEQAQGLRVDRRTDIWSTGVVLYEMLAGRAPFRGPTSSHTIVEILEKEPAALAKAPPELERIVRKALAKNVDERYQSAKDLLIDLKNLRKRLEVEAEIERSSQPPLVGKATSIDDETRTKVTSTVPAAATADLSSRARRTMVLTVLIGAALLAGSLIIFFNFRRAWQVEVLPPAPVAATSSERRVSYWMMVQKYRDGKPFQDPFRLAREINFKKDYRVRLAVSSPQAGHLYILNEGPAPNNEETSFVVLFPSPTANNGSAVLAENQEIQIPQQSWFQFDAETGTEKLWLIFSAKAVPELEAVKRFVNPADQGLVSVADLNHRVHEFLKAHPETKAAVEKNDERKETNLTSKGGLLVHVVLLEHH